MASSSRFPSFRDGDVKIVVTGEMAYCLHGSTLKHNSSTMRELLADDRAPSQLVLVKNDDPDGCASNGVRIEYVFVRVHPGANVRGCESGGRATPPLVSAFDAVLRALYNLPLEIGNPQTDTLTSLLSRAFDITLVAEYLDCAHIVTQAIESTLLACGQNFYFAISQNPIRWLEFATRIQSKAIFKEALIHAAGQFEMKIVQDNTPYDILPEDVITILEDKVNRIKRGVQKAQSCFSSYYPQRIMRARPDITEDREKISRASYSNDIIIWMALSVLRHFLLEQMSRDRTHHASDLGWSFIKTINTGGEAYLSSVELDRGFHTRFPMSGKASACLKQRLTEIKEALKQWTTDLMKDNSQLDTKARKVKYFTNTIVTEDDYPWIYPEDYSDNNVEDDGNIYESIENVRDNVGISDMALDDSDMDEIDDFRGKLGDMATYGQYDDDDLDGVPMSEYAEDAEDTATYGQFDDDDIDGEPIDLDGEEEAEGTATYVQYNDDDLDGEPIDLDTEIMSEYEEDTKEDERRRGAEYDEADQRAAQALLRLNSSRPASPASIHRGDTELMDPKVYENALAEKQMMRDLEAERKRIAEKRHQRMASNADRQ
ncbi:hypothetical protein PRZ48_005775 [Zasmidium cellare]|uniref:BTB domain-containing protein n=1 Tax=Zasmidium cellare TaxID=395010 RepID=A0ABR0EMF3_ZASCE|nr:hypothetical protein PRZ48_005775 [Zasmidium cellare]